VCKSAIKLQPTKPTNLPSFRDWPPLADTNLYGLMNAGTFLTCLGLLCERRMTGIDPESSGLLVQCHKYCTTAIYYLSNVLTPSHMYTLTHIQHWP